MTSRNNVLVLGATGATGRHVVNHLIKNGHEVVALVRSERKLLDLVGDHENLKILEGTALSVSDEDLKSILEECTAVVSCLGHNLSFKGVYGKPMKLVADTVKRVCLGIKDLNDKKARRVILMNTAGFHHKAVDKSYSLSEKVIIGLVRALLPPQIDNEAAANYLIEVVGEQCKSIDWVVVRPDNLTNEDKVTEYKAFATLQRSALTNPGKTSRINTAHFMAELATNGTVLQQWRFKTPVVYNTESIESDII